MIGPKLCIVDIVVLVGEMTADHTIDLLLHKRTDVVEDGLFLFAHSEYQLIIQAFVWIKKKWDKKLDIWINKFGENRENTDIWL